MTIRDPRIQASPLQEIEIIAWYKAKKALGTNKSKSQEMGLTVAALRNVIDRWKKEQEVAAIRAKRAEPKSLSY